MSRRSLRSLAPSSLIPTIRTDCDYVTVRLTLSHPHLAATFLDDAEDSRMRNGRSHRIGRVVDFLNLRSAFHERAADCGAYLELLIVLGLVPHLNFKGVDLEKLGTLLSLVLAVGVRGCMQVTDELNER